MRELWKNDAFTFKGDYHTVTQASIFPRPEKHIPIWFGGGASPLLRRCARLGDGWIPIGTPNSASAQAIETLKTEREKSGLPWEGFGIQAQVQYRGGNPERWRTHFQGWKTLGCTHIAVATHNAGNNTVEEHLNAAREYFDAVA